jgi:uncharacterized membrane protein
MDFEIWPFIAGVLIIALGILSIPYKKTIAKLYRYQYLNALNEKWSEWLTLFMSPFWILLGIFIIYKFY